MLEQLSHNVEGKFWKGPDLVTTVPVTIYDHAHVPFLVTPQSLPPLRGLPPEALRYVHASVRSRYAQTGLDVYEAATQQVARAIMDNRMQNIYGDITREAEVDILIFNHCARPIHLPEGSEVFRFYYELARPAIYGEELVQMVQDREIQIEGKYGADWVWAHSDPRLGGRRDIAGIYVRIKDEDRRWIPPHPEDEPIVVDQESRLHDFRDKIGQLLEPIPGDDRQILWIGETIPVTLDASVEAILDKAVIQDIHKITLKNFGVQINSRLIDGERTNWEIRVEVLSPTSRLLIPNFVLLYFIRNGAQLFKGNS